MPTQADVLRANLPNFLSQQRFLWAAFNFYHHAEMFEGEAKVQGETS